MVCFYNHIGDDGDDSSAQEQFEHEVVEHFTEDLAEALGLDGRWLVGSELLEALLNVAF